MAEELPKKAGATDGDSPDPEKQGANGGESLTQEELAVENKRKSDVIAKLQSEKAKNEAELADLRKRQEEGDLDTGEEEELADREKYAKELAGKLRGMKETDAWRLIMNEQFGEAQLNHDIIEANDYLEDAAVTAGFANWDMSDSEFENAVEKFAKEIAPFTRKFISKLPRRRNEMAVRLWKKESDRIKGIEERETKAKEREDSAQRFRETGSRVARDPSVDQKFKEARSPRDRANLLRDLVATAESPDE